MRIGGSNDVTRKEVTFIADANGKQAKDIAEETKIWEGVIHKNQYTENTIPKMGYITDEEWEILFETMDDLHIPGELRTIRQNSKLQKFLEKCPVLNDILLQDFTENEVNDEIKMLKNNKAHGKDGLVAEAFKIFQPLIGGNYASVLNHQKSCDPFPEKWQKGAVVHLYKNKGKKLILKIIGRYVSRILDIKYGQDPLPEEYKV